MTLIRTITALFMILLCFSSHLVSAAQPGRREALVIGNADYQFGKLPSPVNDAKDMASVLAGMKFRVIEVFNADQAAMNDAVSRFVNRLENAEIALFYYSGHGMQYSERSYLLPIGAMKQMTTPGHAEYKAVAVGYIQTAMQATNAKFNLLFLDACRSVPVSIVKSGNQGLAPLKTIDRMLISYAASPYGRAYDNPEGRNSIYTKHLKHFIAQSGMSILDVMTQVQKQVNHDTGNRQSPVFTTNLTDTLYPVSPPQIPEDKERVLWDHVKNTDSMDALNAYLSAWPNGQYAPAARQRISELKNRLAANSLEQNIRPVGQETRIPVEKRPDEKSFTNSIGMTFVWIPPGRFRMGSPENEPDRDSDEKQHWVTLSKGFYMQTCETTQRQWERIMSSNPSHFRECGDDCPVEGVSWHDVQTFIKQLNQKEEKKYSLPTEAQWEYAARAGSSTAFPNGEITDTGCSDPNMDAMGWYCGNAGRKTHPVGLKQHNDWGLYDMHGNVWEWCSDRYGNYPDGSVTDPVGYPVDSQPLRVIRGGVLVQGEGLPLRQPLQAQA